MSVQFGIWNFDGQPVDPDFLRQAAGLTAKYASDSETFYVRGPVATFFQPREAKPEARLEHQPIANSAGVVLTWDGRLDNGEELSGRLQLSPGLHSDAEIVMAAYERWGTDCFGKLLGDWALTVWDPIEQALFLAKDFIGTRQLFYIWEANRITYSTVLDPLVLCAGHPLKLSEEFIAGHLSIYPAIHLTPYAGIHAVPAGSFLQIEPRRCIVRQYWQFDPSYRLRYRQDREYEEHYRQLLTEAVKRRLRTTSPVLAELSGGMDSTSIVCVADALMSNGHAETPRLDTVSYYDDDEPNWNERPYFSLVEQKRGREGYHINVATTEGAFLPPDDGLFFPLPGFDRRDLNRRRELNRCLVASHSRVLLSGIGGDEFNGGIPTPLPELQDLFTRFQWLRFARQLARFSLQQRRSLLFLGFDAVEEFLPQSVRRLYKNPRVPPWLTPAFARRHADIFWTDLQRTHLSGACPSFQTAIATVNHLRRKLNGLHLTAFAQHDVSYPYLDRDLLSFLFAAPREQFVRPGQRRSLMRRSLVDVVPPQILGRKRKAFVARRPLALIDGARTQIDHLLHSSRLVAHGWADPNVLAAKREALSGGELECLIPLITTLKLELWMQHHATGVHINCAAARDPFAVASRSERGGTDDGHERLMPNWNAFDGIQPHGAECCSTRSSEEKEKYDVLQQTATYQFGRRQLVDSQLRTQGKVCNRQRRGIFPFCRVRS